MIVSCTMDNSVKTELAVCSTVNLVFYSKEAGNADVAVMQGNQEICTNELEI